MQPFLDKLAKHLYSAHGENFSRICLVFPGRRASLFFKQYLSQLIDKPIWLPDVYALEDFVVYKSGLSLSDPLDLISRLYKVYKSIEKLQAQPFSEFISWGNMLLNDFDEIDQYLADGEKVFQYLDEIKALKHWNPDGEPLTAFELKYLHFYNSLAPCYVQFRSELLKNNEAYFGLAFDTLLHTIGQKSFDEWDKIVFAGFNALTIAEEKLLQYLTQTGKAEIYWDADEYYLTDSRQEAGRFMREHIKKNTFGELNWISNSLSNEPKSIQVIGVPGNVGQAKLAGSLLRDIISKKGSAEGVALVLVDEGLLLPVLNSIPLETGDFNVTMGFPLKQTPVFSLFNIVVTMFGNAHHYARPELDAKTGDLPELRFYYKDVQRFMSHPFIISAGVVNANNPQVKGKTTLDRSFYSPEELYAYILSVDGELSGIFKPFLLGKLYEPGNVLQLILHIIDFLHVRFLSDENDEKAQLNPNQTLETEYLYHAAQLCTKLLVITQDAELKPDIQTLQSLVNNLIAGMRLPFYGEPLKGLQVMGMLETRLLDFTHIIMISVNEGLLPRGKHQTTFIPDEVRSHFGMQRYTERTAVFAYHFYRLMQRVENAWLIYNTEGDELGGGEKSRFISQLLYELPSKNPGLLMTEQILSVVPGNTQSIAITIKKNASVIARLRLMSERGLSPTALAMYMNCSLQFYFSQVLQISEPDKITETIDAATLGEIVHEALQKTYESRKNERITSLTITAMIPEAVLQVQSAIRSRLNTSEVATGKNMLIVKVAENMVKRFLAAEKKYLDQSGANIEIVMLEGQLESSIQIKDTVTGAVMNVKIHGKADRIDRVAGVTRIIDYKTGKAEAKDLKIDQIANLRVKENPAKLIQVLAYAMMYSDMNKHEHVELNSGIISLRKTSSYLIKTDINKTDTIDRSILSDFRHELETIVGSIFNASEEFSQTENIETCALCTFNTICNRTVN